MVADVEDHYEVDKIYRPYLSVLQRTHMPRRFALWERGGRVLSPSERGGRMMNKLAHVTFRLKIKPQVGLLADVESASLMD